MAFHKTLANRFLHLAKTCSSQFRPSITRKLLPDSDNALIRRFLHKDPIPPDRFPLPQSDNLVERIRMLNGPRIRFDCLIPPKIQKAEEEEEENHESKISMVEVRKVLKAAQLEMARSRLRSMQRECISYAEFLKVCGEISNLDQGLGVAKALDESGVVIVLGNVVFLWPDQGSNEGVT